VKVVISEKGVDEYMTKSRRRWMSVKIRNAGWRHSRRPTDVQMSRNRHVNVRGNKRLTEGCI
jgi:hypothetical protein